MALSVEKSQRGYALYAGSGEYVTSVHVYGAAKVTREIIYFGGLNIAASFGREDAVRVCHTVRRAGRAVWMVRHPAGALS